MAEKSKRFPYEHVIAIIIGIVLFYFGWQAKGLIKERGSAAENTMRLRSLYLQLKTYCNEYGSYPSTAGKERYSKTSSASDLNLLFSLGYSEEAVNTNLWSYNANALPDSKDPLVSEKGAGMGKAKKPVLLLRANGEITKVEPKNGELPKDLCPWEKLGD